MADEKYTPPFTMTNEMTNLVIEIGELVGQISMRDTLSANPTLRRKNRIKTIHSSLAIEQNSLSLSQVTDVIDGKRVLAPPQDIREAKNAYEAYEQLSKLNPYSIEDLLTAHRFMMDGLIREAGCFRSSGVGVFSGGKLIHAGTPANYVPELMEQLFSWLQSSDLHPLVKSCVFHYEFEFVHPFSDGNGRTGRLWHSLILQNWKPFFAWLPIETLIHEQQDGYYAALNASNAENSSTCFILFMLTIIRDALSELPSSSPRDVGENVGDDVGETTSTPVQRCLAILRENPNSSARQIAEVLNLSSRQVERILSTLKEDGRIERVGPAKGGRWKVID